MAYDPPYKPSRAALRERYGSRSIDASAPQSNRDFTPSGRLRYREGQGMSEPAAAQAVESDFYNMLRARMAGRQLSPDGKTETIPLGAASAFKPSPPGFLDPVTPTNLIPVGGRPAPFSSAAPSNLTPLSFNLLEPSSLTASAIAPYATASSTPPMAYTPSWKKKPNQGYMGSILAPASKWLV